MPARFRETHTLLGLLAAACSPLGAAATPEAESWTDVLPALFWGSMVVAVPIWVCSWVYGTIGIDVGRLWPNPSCCCYESHKSAGDAASCYYCAPLLHVCVLLLGLQAGFLVVHSALFVGSGVLWVTAMFGLMMDVVGVAMLIAAIALLVRGYCEHGWPERRGASRRGPAPLAGHQGSSAQMVHRVQVAPPAVGTMVYGTPVYDIPPVRTVTLTGNGEV